MEKLIIFLLLISLSKNTIAQESITPGTFAGRISRLNPSASLMRVRLDFANSKFLRTNDGVEFWNEGMPMVRCQAAIVGKSGEYFLMRVYEWKYCISKVGFSVGSHVYFESKDLEKTLITAREMVRVLLQKRMVLQSQTAGKENDVNDQSSQLENINARYEAMIERIKNEWNEAIKGLSGSKSANQVELNSLRAQLDEIDFQLERYRVEDANFKKDRWAIDPTVLK
jgi:hypothetical protein